MAGIKSSKMRIDKELEKLIRDYAEKNECTLRQASKEIARLRRFDLRKGSVMSEVKF